jgi:hypothetical protein
LVGRPLQANLDLHLGFFNVVIFAERFHLRRQNLYAQQPVRQPFIGDFTFVVCLDLEAALGLAPLLVNGMKDYAGVANGLVVVVFHDREMHVGYLQRSVFVFLVTCPRQRGQHQCTANNSTRPTTSHGRILGTRTFYRNAP